MKEITKAQFDISENTKLAVHIKGEEEKFYEVVE